MCPRTAPRCRSCLLPPCAQPLQHQQRPHRSALSEGNSSRGQRCFRRVPSRNVGEWGRQRRKGAQPQESFGGSCHDYASWGGAWRERDKGGVRRCGPRSPLHKASVTHPVFMNTPYSRRIHVGAQIHCIIRVFKVPTPRNPLLGSIGQGRI